MSQAGAIKHAQVSREGVRGAFAAVRADGSVVTWGDPSSGGYCRMVGDQLIDVQEIFVGFEGLLRNLVGSVSF